MKVQDGASEPQTQAAIIQLIEGPSMDKYLDDCLYPRFKTWKLT